MGREVVDGQCARVDDSLERVALANADVVTARAVAVSELDQQGTTDSSQEMTVSDQTVGAIESFVSDLQGKLAELEGAGLSEDAAAEVTAQILTT